MRESHTVLNVLLMLRCVCLSLTNVQSVAVIQTHKIVDEYSREKNRLHPVRAQTSNFALKVSLIKSVHTLLRCWMEYVTWEANKFIRHFLSPDASASHWPTWCRLWCSLYDLVVNLCTLNSKLVFNSPLPGTSWTTREWQVSIVETR